MTRLQTQRLAIRTPVAIAVAIALGASQLAHAQEGVEEVTVTGSRIAVEKGMETPTPVTAVSSEDLQRMSSGNVIDALQILG